MKRIVVLDTWTNNTNLGNKIIVEAVYKALKEIFPHDFFYQVPALEYLQAGRVKIEQADYVFLAGTNILSSNMEKTSNWCVRPTEKFWMNKVILMGLGWWQYQKIEPNLYTRSLLNQILNKDYLHSFRDSYTTKRMEELEFQGINTGCPTIWWLNKEHCAAIPHSKSDKVLLTFTEYNQNPKYDRLLFEVLEKNYSTIYFWPQMYMDYYYAKEVCGERIVFIDPSLEALDSLLKSEDIDYVGTRLHAGVRALQHQRRAIIIAVDNRAIEMGKDFNLPILTRGEIAINLEGKINEAWATSVNLDQEVISNWKKQFETFDRSETAQTLKAGKVCPVVKLEADENSRLEEPSFIQYSDENIKLVINQAIEELNAKNNAQALSLLEMAIAANPDMPELNYGKAVALARLGCPNQAVETLNQLLNTKTAHRKAQLLLEELRPSSVRTLMQRATQCLDTNAINEAFSLLSQAKSLKQPTIGLDYLRANCLLQINQPGAALQCLYEELRYFPNNAEAKNLLDQLLAQFPQLVSGKIDDAEFQELLQTVRPYTMLSEARLYSLFHLAKRVCLQNIPGNFVECGVAGGGSTALMAMVIKRYTKQPRWLYAFDSFDGMPAPTEQDKHNGILAEATGWGTGTCAAHEASVRELCSKLGLLDIVRTVKGYFQDTLPKMRNTVGMMALLHMDGDWYESTKAILHNLYERVVSDGFIQVDGYGHWEGCRKAVHEFEAMRQIKFDINPIDGTGVWFPRPDKFPINPVFEPTLVNEFAEDDPVAHGLQSQMSRNERFQLYYALRQLLADTSVPLRFVEIGSFAGSSLFLTVRALKRIASQLQGFAIEPGGHPQLPEVLKQLEREVTHLPLFSHQAVPQLKQVFEQDGKLPTFIFVDGDHTYEGVRQDIIDYFPLLAPGGIMMFHDYLPPLSDENWQGIMYHHAGNEPGIRQACQELMENTYGCEVLDIPLLYPTDPTQTQGHLPIIPGVFSTVRAYRKPQVRARD